MLLENQQLLSNLTNGNDISKLYYIELEHKIELFKRFFDEGELELNNKNINPENFINDIRSSIKKIFPEKIVEENESIDNVIITQKPEEENKHEEIVIKQKNNKIEKKTKNVIKNAGLKQQVKEST